MKKLIIIISTLGLALSITANATTSITKQEKYYTMHPDVLQKVIASCPDKAPGNISCNQLQEIAMRLNALIFELRDNSFEYGNAVLALQQKISDATNNPDSNIDADRRQLNERLAIVSWLASPKS